MENKKRNWEAPQIITVNPEQTESGTSGLNVNEGYHNSFTVTYAS